MTPKSSTANPWPDSFLDSMRGTGDPQADRVIAELAAQGEVSAVNSLMRTLVANEYPAPEALPSIVREYLAETAELPAWADPDIIARGESVFWRYGPRLILILHCYSLPFCYLGRNGVPVLALTSRLSGNPARRIMETAQMLVDVMQPGGLTSPLGRGRRTIQKVRLMHAAVRRLVQLSPEWKAQFGLPVNQEDLAGTLLSFSWVSLDGLKRLGVEVPPADQEGYLYAWRVVGHLLGVRDDINPTDMQSAEVLKENIARRQFGPSDDGKMMTDALVKAMQYTLPGDALDNLPPLFIRYFLGREYAAMLGVEDNRLASALAGPLRIGGRIASDILHDSAAVSHLAEKLSRILIESIVFIGRGGTRPAFSIPTELQQQWGVNWTA